MAKQTSNSRPAFAYVGCFTYKERKAHGKGISVYKVDPETATWTLVDLYEADNPGFLALHSNQKFLYVAHGSDDVISAYSVDPRSGKLSFVNRQATGGDNSRHLAIDPTGRYVVLNNGDGVAVYPINRDGSLAPYTDMIVPHAAPGSFREEEGGPHPHDIVFDPSGRFVVVPDKGLDKIHVYKLDAVSGKLVANDPPLVASRPGAGPRHIAFHSHQPYAYVVGEVDSNVAAYRWDSTTGELHPFQVISTTPPGYNGKNTGSEIAITDDGNFVYASNRGHDSIVIYGVDQSNGSLSTIGWESTQGKTPRFFAMDRSNTVLCAANQDSDTIVIFDVDRATGKLTPTGQVLESGTPICVVFAYH
jgi:6-phosphogluconolactonase